MIKLLLVDDEPAVRQGLKMRLALEPDMEVVGEAGDGAAALREAEAHQPNVVVMDIVMPGIDGITACARLRDRAPAAVVVILTLYDQPESRSLALAAGACCMVGKHEAPDALVKAIREAASNAGPGAPAA